MIFFLNRGLILERETDKALEKYFSLLGLASRYKNFTVKTTVAHPFARVFASKNPEAEAASLFPAVVVSAERDQKPPALAQASEPLSFSLGEADLRPGEGGGPSPVEARYQVPQDMAALMREAVAGRPDGLLHCLGWRARRQETVAVEIWSENPQLNAELYELVRLFACGFLREYLQGVYARHFGGEGGALAIFDSSVKGQRQAGVNFDFGTALYGSRLSFDADCIIEQAVADTELDGSGMDFLPEVIERVYTAG